MSRALAGLFTLVLVAACADSPVGPGVPAPSAGIARISCTATVASPSVSCTDVAPRGGVRTTRILGNQDKYVKLASSGTGYNNTSQILFTTITVQNLLPRNIGTDGFSTTGVRVFLAAPPVTTGGTGTVGTANHDGTAAFTASDQAFFLYNEVLAPYQISAGKLWQFAVPNTVTSFTFTLFVAADQSDETLPLLDAVWNGLSSTAWNFAGNWTRNTIPDSMSAVTVFADSVAASGRSPMLTDHADVGFLRMGSGTTLGLDGFTMRVRGNVDAPGTISGGTVWLSGATLIRGNVPVLKITGGTRLQGATRATGAVSVADGSLTVADHALSIQVP